MKPEAQKQQTGLSERKTLAKFLAWLQSQDIILVTEGVGTLLALRKTTQELIDSYQGIDRAKLEAEAAEDEPAHDDSPTVRSAKPGDSPPAPGT